MNTSTLKILVPMILLVVVIFAVTFFSQYVPKGPETTTSTSQEESGEPPLIFPSERIRMWKPVSDNLQNRFFQGFYEPGDTQNTVSFWFENPNSKPVTIQLLGVSCTACSGGRVATIPPEIVKEFLQMTAVSVLPHGLMTGLPLAMVGQAAQLDSARNALSWQSHRFSQDPATVTYNVPAATGDGWAPRWGILELNFQVHTNPKLPLAAKFITQVQGTEQIRKESFEIFFEPSAPFEVYPTTIDAGDLTDISAPQTHEIVVYSSTRKADELADLTVRVLMPPGVGGEPGGFVTVGSLAPIAEPALDQFMLDLSVKTGRPVRVRSAYKFPVTIKGRDGDARLDIGDMGRVIYIAQGHEQKSVTVKGLVRGPVYLSHGKEINLGSFSTARGTNERVAITTDRSDIDLEVVRDQTRPSYMEVSLEKQTRTGNEDQGHYQLKVTIPGGKQEGAIRDGVIVLAIKGQKPQRMRIPVRGQGNR